MDIGSLVVKVLIVVVKYFPPTLSVTHSEFDTTGLFCSVIAGDLANVLTLSQCFIKFSPSETYKISSSLKI